MNALTRKELAEIDGGVAPVLIWLGGVVFGSAITAVIGNVADNWGDFKQGIREGYNSTVNSN